MTIYSYVESGYCEPRFYFNYGEMIFRQVVQIEPTEANFTSFNPVLQRYANEELDEDDNFDFFRYMVAYADIGFDEWPLPIYDWDTKPENKKNAAILRNFLLRYLFPKYWDCYLLPYGNEDTEEEKERVYHRFFDKFLNLLIASFHKYVPLIKLYKDKEASLLDRVTSVTNAINRYNDTPQDSGDFSDDAHTTNISKAESSVASDYETPMKRLKEIRDAFENLYNAWASDFDILFSKGGETL